MSPTQLEAASAAIQKVPDILQPILVDILQPGDPQQQRLPGLAARAEGLSPLVKQQLDISKPELAPYFKAVIDYLSSVARGAEALVQKLDEIAEPAEDKTEAGETIEVDAEVGAGVA